MIHYIFPHHRRARVSARIMEYVFHREMPREDKGNRVSYVGTSTEEDPLNAPGFSSRHSCINCPQHQRRCSRSRLLEVPENGEKSLNVKICQNMQSLKVPSTSDKIPSPHKISNPNGKSVTPKHPQNCQVINTTMLFRTRSDFFHLVLLWPLG